MAPKHSPTGKLQRRTAFPPDLGEAEDRAKEVPSKSQELEDLDVAQMAQQMMNAVHLIASRLCTMMADHHSD